MTGSRKTNTNDRHYHHRRERSIVISQIDYCNAVLAGVHDVHLQQLQAVLNAAARLIVRKRKYDGISATIRDVLHWLPSGVIIYMYATRVPIHQHPSKICGVEIFNVCNFEFSSYLSKLNAVASCMTQGLPSHQNLQDRC